jgi:NitT/TauT family transport system substrate-binding protein
MPMRTRRSIIVASILAVFILFFIAASAAAAPKKKIVVTFADFSERTTALFVAQDRGFFAEQGLDAELVQIRSGPVSMSALATGETQFYGSGATGANLGAMAQGLDVVFIAGLVNKLDGYFVVGPKVKNIDDLKGKTLGVQSMGGGIWTYTMAALDYWGLVPERDKIDFRVLGDQSVLAQSLARGMIDGAFLGYTFSKMAERQGCRILAELPKANVPYQMQGILARRSFIEQSPDVAERSLRALSRSIGFIQEPANKQAVLRTLAKWLRVPQIEGGDELYERMKINYDRRIYPTKDGLARALRILTKANPKIGALKVENLFDNRIVHKLEMDRVF